LADVWVGTRVGTPQSATIASGFWLVSKNPKHKQDENSSEPGEGMLFLIKQLNILARNELAQR
jgi:hypothetical protein